MQSSILPQLKIVSDEGFSAKFSFEPLETTYGITVGNALRRTLLSGLKGVAITAFRVGGVVHEFSTIPGVKEDALDVSLNIKKIRVKKLQDFDGSIQMSLSKVKNGVVTAKDIICPPQVEIVNTDLVICNLVGKKAKLEMDFVVEEGRGYAPVYDRGPSKMAIDYIPVDALFSPVEKVMFKVEPTRVGQKTNFDNLIIDLTTDGTLTPLEAINLSAAILVEHFTILVDENNFKPEAQIALEIEEEAAEQTDLPPSDLTIEDLGLSTRVLNSLHQAGIDTVADLVERNEDSLKKLKNFGQKSLVEIAEKLKEKNLSLKSE